MPPKPNLHRCKYRGCDNVFSVTHVNGGQKYCSPSCRRLEAIAVTEDKRRARIATAAQRDEYYRSYPLPGSTRYGKRMI